MAIVYRLLPWHYCGICFRVMLQISPKGSIIGTGVISGPLTLSFVFKTISTHLAVKIAHQYLSFTIDTND